MARRAVRSAFAEAKAERGGDISTAAIAARLTGWRAQSAPARHAEGVPPARRRAGAARFAAGQIALGYPHAARVDPSNRSDRIPRQFASAAVPSIAAG